MSCTYDDENFNVYDYFDEVFIEDDVVWWAILPFCDSKITWRGKLSIIGQSNRNDGDGDDDGDDADDYADDDDAAAADGDVDDVHLY